MMFAALQYPFFAHALVAGTAIAVVAGLAGFFLVVRGQVFTGDALGHVAFTGAAAALALGVDVRFGLFAATIGVGVLIGALRLKGRTDDVVIGNVLAWVLGLGVFFLTLYTTSQNAGNGTAGVSVLFGSIFGLSAAQVTSTVVVAAIVAVLLLAIARPLLFATLDEGVASALGVPVRWLGILLLALVGVATAQATEAVGALLVLGLLAAPAGTAQRLTSRPFAALALSSGVAVLDVWAGLALSFLVPALPPSFSILAVASAVYLIAIVATGRPRRVEPIASAGPAVTTAGFGASGPGVRARRA
jgi:zinc/manganese transport system permease protein